MTDTGGFDPRPSARPLHDDDSNDEPSREDGSPDATARAQAAAITHRASTIRVTSFQHPTDAATHAPGDELARLRLLPPLKAARGYGKRAVETAERAEWEAL